MKKFALAAAFAVASTAAFAGGMDAPVMEAPVIIEEAVNTATASSGSNLILPLIALLAIAATVQ